MFYSVYLGRQPGIYTSWDKCQQQVSKFPGAKFKKFSSQSEAQYFLETGIIPVLEDKVSNCKIEKDESQIENSDILNIYTDGSCPGNGKMKCRGGIGVHFSNSKHPDISESCEEHPTNQKMELLAIERALQEVIPYQSNYQSIQLYTDSQYSIDCVTKYISNWIKNNWKTSKNEPVKNKDIIKSIYQIKLKFKNLSLHHINSHTGKQDQHSLGNEKADKLAFRAATE